MILRRWVIRSDYHIAASHNRLIQSSLKPQKSHNWYFFKTKNMCKNDEAWIQFVTREGDKGVTESNRPNLDIKDLDTEKDGRPTNWQTASCYLPFTFTWSLAERPSISSVDNRSVELHKILFCIRSEVSRAIKSHIIAVWRITTCSTSVLTFQNTLPFS